MVITLKEPRSKSTTTARQMDIDRWSGGRLNVKYSVYRIHPEYAPLKHELNGYLTRTLYPDVFVEDAYKRLQWQEQEIKDPQIITSVDSMPFWRRGDDGTWIKLKMVVQVLPEMKSKGVSDEFKNYAICLWNIPQEFAHNPNQERIKTNAHDFIVAKNTAGEYHLVLFFDLKPDATLDVRIAE